MKDKQVIIGTLLNYAVLTLQMLSMIVITPFIISRLGDSTYGVYRVTSSIVAYMGILNFGFGNAAIRYLVEIKSKHDMDREKEFLSVIKMMNLAAIIVAAAAGLILYTVIPRVFSGALTANEIITLRQMFAILVVSVIINILNDIYIAIITAHEHFIFLKTLDLIRCILRIILIFSILTMRPSAAALVIIDLTISILAFFCNNIYCRLKLNTRPKYSIQILGTIDKSFYKPVITYAGFFFLNLVITQLVWNTDSVIIGMRLSSFDAAVYGSSTVISSGFYSFSLVIGNLMFTQVVRLVGSKPPKKELTDIMIRIGRTQAYIAMFIMSVYFACGRQFVSLWLGPNYKAAWAASLLVMTATLFSSLLSGGNLILRAMNRQKYILGVYITIFTINAVATYIVVADFGIVGAAYATLISYAVGGAAFLAPYFHKIIGIDMIRFLKKLLLPVGIPSSIGVAFFLIYSSFQIDSWLKLAIAATVQVIICCLATYMLALNNEERSVVANALTNLSIRSFKR